MNKKKLTKGFMFERLMAKWSKKHEDAFWYYGEDIAKIHFPNGKSLYAMTSGEIRIQFKEDGTFYKGDQALEQAFELGLDDEGLNKLSEFDGWDMNNWFVIREYDINGDMIGDDLAICHDYDVAITLLEELAEEKHKEYYA
jgi:hypothetical protein